MEQVLTFYEVFRIGLDEEPHNPICDTLVESVSINKETNVLTATLRSDVLCDGAAVSTMRENLAAWYCLERVVLNFRFP